MRNRKKDENPKLKFKKKRPTGQRIGKSKQFSERPSTNNPEEKPKTVKVRQAETLTEKIRLNRFIANAGVCVRREADEYITSGAITVNGKTVTEIGTKVNIFDDIRLAGEQLIAENMVYLLLNKPKDYTTVDNGNDEERNVMYLIKHACKERIYPVGILDKSSTGLLLFTNDARMAKKLTRRNNRREHLYHVFFDKKVSSETIEKIKEGLKTEYGNISIQDIQYSSENMKEIGLRTSTDNSETIKTALIDLGLTVNKLDRVIYSGLTKKNLPRGKWRFLSQDEVNHLNM